MCDPMTVGIASVATNALGQLAAHNASVSAAKATAKSAEQSRNLQIAQENERLRQETAATTKEKENAAIDRRIALGEIIAGADATSGNNMQVVGGDVLRQEGRYGAALTDDLSFKTSQAFLNRDSHQASYKSRVESAKSSILPAPSLLGVATGLAGAYVNSKTLASAAKKKG